MLYNNSEQLNSTATSAPANDINVVCEDSIKEIGIQLEVCDVKLNTRLHSSEGVLHCKTWTTEGTARKAIQAHLGSLVLAMKTHKNKNKSNSISSSITINNIDKEPQLRISTTSTKNTTRNWCMVCIAIQLHSVKIKNFAKIQRLWFYVRLKAFPVELNNKNLPVSVIWKA